MLRHGLAPMDVIAARPTGRYPVGPTEAPQRGLRIRRAGSADIDAVVRLGVEVIRFDAHFGGVTERPGTAAAMRREAAGLLAGPEPWTWLAERDGTAIGLLAAQRPEAASWIAPMVRAAPAAYLMLMFVLPGERAILEPAGVPATLDLLGGQAGSHGPLGTPPVVRLIQPSAAALSLGIWKNGDRRTKRATNMSTTPEATTPATDQSCGAGAASSDLIRSQVSDPQGPRHLATSGVRASCPEHKAV